MLDIGLVRRGYLADMILIDENPLENLKVLYGTGAVKLMDDGTVARVGGIKYTIKDGVVYDAEKLRADVRDMVARAKMERAMETADGQELMARKSGDSILLTSASGNKAIVTQANVEQANGVVHVIDAVLLPRM